MTVKAGHERDFERLAQQLAGIIRDREPGVLQYEFFRLREPRTYALLQSFESREAEQAHLNGALLAEHGPGLLEFLVGDYNREFLYPLGTD